MLESITRSRLTLPLLALGFAALYLPSVGFGYRGNDFELLTTASSWIAGTRPGARERLFLPRIGIGSAERSSIGS